MPDPLLPACTQQPFQRRGAGLLRFAGERREIFAGVACLVLRLRQRQSFRLFSHHPCPARRTEGQQRGYVALLRAARQKIWIAEIKNIAEAEAACVNDGLVDGVTALGPRGGEPRSRAVPAYPRQP